MPSLLDTLLQRPLLCDGATGTQLQLLGLGFGACGELWNIDAPDKVQQVHRNYANAGSDLLTTNTFGGTRLAMARHGIQDRQQEINRAAARLAREIAGPGRWVLGDLGPCGDLLDPYGEIQPEALYQDFLDQSRALLEGGADALLVETMSDPAETAIGVRAAKAAGAPVVIATYAFQRSAKGFKTMMGTDVATAVDAAIQAGAQIVGTNCGTSLSLADYLELARELVAAAKGVPVIVQPNAGSPTLVNGVATYNESAETMGQLAVDLIKAGVRIVGGCCGTEPKHIAAMRAAMDRSI